MARNRRTFPMLSQPSTCEASSPGLVVSWSSSKTSRRIGVSAEKMWSTLGVFTGWLSRLGDWLWDEPVLSLLNAETYRGLILPFASFSVAPRSSGGPPEGQVRPSDAERAGWRLLDDPARRLGQPALGA